jgi:hypothetical protein
LRSQRTEPQKDPSVVWITIRSSERIGRFAGVRFFVFSTATRGPASAGAALVPAAASTAESATNEVRVRNRIEGAFSRFIARTRSLPHMIYEKRTV